MSLPVYRGQSSGVQASTTTATPTDPTGIAIGDLEILVGFTDFLRTLSITTDGGSAWTAIAGTPVNLTTTTGEALYVWWRVRQSGDSAPTVTCSADHVGVYEMAVCAGTFNAATPIEIENTSFQQTSNTSYSYAPGTTTGGPDRMIFAVATSQIDSTTPVEVTAAVNATLTNVGNTTYVNTAAGNGGGSNTCRGSRVAAGGVGTFSATWNTASRKNYCSFAVIGPTGTIDSLTTEPMTPSRW